uniref:Uncharacterized protein n=1 Tax=Leuconostoc citreum TaxID=33964 RepID=A0A0A1IRV2_LEUCI|nr:Protein of unknown function [Leuconostoc citreum]
MFQLLLVHCMIKIKVLCQDKILKSHITMLSMWLKTQLLLIVFDTKLNSF